MPKKVYLVRHGESEDGVLKLHQANDAALSEHGRHQAKDAAERFRNISIDVIFSSPYQRTHETAEHISAVTGVRIETNELLHERRQPKEIIGKSRTDSEVVRIKSIIKEHRNDPSWHYSDEENFFEVRDRVKQIIQWVVESPHEHIVIVSHAVLIKIFVLLTVFEDQVTPDMFLSYYAHVRTSQTGITMLQYKEDGWKLLTWNDYAHLGEDGNV